jgi:hypothetical protein
MSKIWILLGVMMCLVFTAMPAMAVELGVRGYYWLPDLDGNVSYDGDVLDATELDLADDLGMERESYPMIEVFAGFGDHHLSFTYYQASYSGSETLDTTIEFGDETYTAGADIDSELDYTVMDFAYQWDAIDLENVLAGASLGLIGKVKYLDITASVDEDTIGKEEADISVPIPMVGVNLHVGILADIIEARLQVTGMGYSGNTVVEFLGDVSYTPFPFMDLHAGYRSFSVTVDVEDVEADLTTAGPYVALTIGF